jgi:DNA-binding CsgD family transcriptional regulator
MGNAQCVLGHPYWAKCTIGFRGSICVLTSVTTTTKSIATARTPSAPASAPGLVVIDASGDPIAFNAAAAEILCYPDKIKNTASWRASLVSRLNHALDHLADDPSSLVQEFTSGRRLYFCRVFRLTSADKKISSPMVVVLLNRSCSELLSLSKIAKQFHLSPRELESVELLLKGLTSKEIAQRMKVSANTVKAFLRVVMIKTGASTRSAIVAKITTAAANGFHSAD